MSAENLCPYCGKPVAATTMGGLRPECMLKAGFGETESGETIPAEKRAAPPKPENIAPLFPQLELLECLGWGGMGAVYKARQSKLGRFVALKIIARHKENDPRFAERFAREAQALARLSHPNIVAVYDFGETAGLCYLLMEFVDGMSLRQLLQAGRITPEQALTIVPRICEALQFAHEHGVVHRDVKPENILLDKQGRVKIADFGIAKLVGGDSSRKNLTGEAQVMGTPHYMAPEQVEKPQEVDHRADIYSLGVVFYEMLTGELPLGKFQPPSRKVQVDVRLDEVVLHALEKEPERRYQRAGEVKTDVEAIVNTPVAQQAPITPTGRQRAAKWRVIVVVAGVAVIFISALLILKLKGNAAKASGKPLSGLVGWWRAEGNATDSIGTNNGILRGTATFGPGEVGQAFSFDGTSGYVLVPNSPSLDTFSNSLTVELWVKPNSQTTNAEWKGIVCKGSTSWRLQATSGASSATFSATGLSPQDLPGTRNINDGQWHHVAAVYDGTNVYLYVDGSLDVMQAVTGSIAQNNVPLAIGENNQPTPGHYMFDGMVDEVALYNRALSSNEIAAIYNASSSGLARVTNSTLTPNNVQLSQANTDYVTVTGPPPPAGIISLWPAEGSAKDIVGSNNGAVVGDLSYTHGQVGQAFVFDGTSSYIELASSPGLQVGLGPRFTIECWILPAATALAPIVEWDSPSSDGLQFWVSGNNQLFANLKDTSGADHQLVSAMGILNNRSFQHVALTYDQASGNAVFYLNAAVVVSTNIGSITPQTSYPEYHLNIGRRTGQPVGLNDTYEGLLDELAVYGRALSQSEIQEICDVGRAGKRFTPVRSGILTNNNDHTVRAADMERVKSGN